MTGSNLYAHPERRTVLHPPHVNKTPFTKDYASVDVGNRSVPHVGNQQSSIVNKVVASQNKKVPKTNTSHWQKTFQKMRWAAATASVVIFGGAVAHQSGFSQQTLVETARLTAFLFVGDMILPSVFEN